MLSATVVRSGIALIFIALVLIADRLLVLPDNLFGRSVQNALHIPTFFAFTVLLHFLFRSWRLSTLLLVALGAGVALELTQMFSPRDASVADLFRDLLGIGLGLTVAVGHVGTPGTARFISSSFPGGANVWNIPIEALLRAGSTEPRISQLIVHSSPDYAGASILLAEIKLTRRN